MLEKMSPEASARFRAKIEKDYDKRYALFEQMAQAPAPGAEEADLDGCEGTATAEHSRPGTGEACDDGR
jgi:pyruvate-ferredoxin/flavodoxin oxidoreductase